MGFPYKYLPLAEKIRKYENDLEIYNKKVGKEDQIIFENTLIETFINIIDNHIIFNYKRSLDLHKAKKSLIFCIVLTVLNFIIFSFTLLLNFIIFSPTFINI